MKSLFIGFLLLTAVGGFAQDKILLMSGKVLEGKVLLIDTSGVSYEYQKGGKTKQVLIDPYRVYSVELTNGNVEVLYTQDSIEGRVYSVEQMYAFVEGERTALENFNGAVTVIYSLTMGVLTPIIIPSIVAIPIGLVLSLGALIIPPVPRINPEKVEDKELIKHEAFYKGYVRVVRSKKLNRSILAGAGGLVIGFVAQSFIK